MSMEDESIDITCPTCRAPVGVKCIVIEWKAGDGKYTPVIHPRFEPHSKRVRRYEKFRYQVEVKH